MKFQQLLDELVRAWNARDGASFSRLFVEDADYVTGAGVRLAGRRAIQGALFERSANALEGGPIALVTESVKALGPDAAVILCTWRMATRTGVMTIVTLRTDDGWRIIALQNTDTVK